MINNYTAFCSWSGGKDSCQALFRAVNEGAALKYLVTMFNEHGDKTRSHGLPLSIIEAQANSLGIPLISRSKSWDDYESNFINVLQKLEVEGVQAGIFGDIDFEPHREWTKMVCETAGLNAVNPLWNIPREKLLSDFFKQGFKATIIAVKDGILDADYLGQELNASMLREFDRLGLDIAGENGEYHTLVTDGPLFKHPIELPPGKIILSSGCWFLELDQDF